ncbi:MAG: site-2 protease family protein [Dissulfuribacterales bacterium]
MLPNFNPIEFIIIIVPLLFAVTAHEVAHGYVAYKLGDPTAKNAGRLSLNPIRHLDIFGSFLLPIILKLSGAPILFGYAKPVPVNFANLRQYKTGTVLVASAGVVTNFALAIISAGGFQILRHIKISGGILILQPMMVILIKLFAYSVMINLVLAIFNLIPIPPLDGGRILTVLLPHQARQKLKYIEPFGFLILIFLLFTNSLDLLITFFITPLINLMLGG